MAEGRGSAMSALMIFTLSLMLLLQFERAEAATYVVGGAGGWTFNVAGWPKGKQFKAGDVLGNYFISNWTLSVLCC